MRTSKIQIGAKVFNKKNQSQEGTITKVITKSTGYVEVTYLNGEVKKEMAFNLLDENGEQLKATPKVRKHVPTMEERIQSTKNSLLEVNENRFHSMVAVYIDMFNHAEIESEFINSLVDTYVRASIGMGHISEKQAYYLAKYIIENNL